MWTHDGAIRHGDEGQRDGPGDAKGIDNATLLLLIEGLSIHFPNRIDIRRLFLSDRLIRQFGVCGHGNR